MTGGNLLHKIVSKIDDFDERDINELPPLYDSVDVDALQAVVESGVERVEFRHAGYHIVITHNEVSVRNIIEDRNEQ
ncbi:HalOD1 output domain-containing protein [Halopenitus persicus]|uniref:Halobacterial output domain-containing protein n=1 Tax=Halopenitus persicus TaxID=1048396 RepID=A0A1H3JIZ3_9EURY|nr:hypothetical protein SAMN05216564_10533 [Halopenitus persicus]